MAAAATRAPVDIVVHALEAGERARGPRAAAPCAVGEVVEVGVGEEEERDFLAERGRLVVKLLLDDGVT